MACTNDKFVINKGLTNEFLFTIKQNDSTLPMTITDSDVFIAKFYELTDNTEVATVTMTDNSEIGLLEVHDSANGQIKILLYDAFVSTLKTDRGDRADGYYNKPMYRLAIDCTTENNGNFVAKINSVYVEA